MKGKYACRNVSNSTIEYKSNDSYLQKTFLKLWPNLYMEEFQAIGNRENVNIWDKKWIDTDIKLRNVTSNICSYIVSMLVDMDGKWDVSILSSPDSSEIPRKDSCYPSFFSYG